MRKNYLDNIRWITVILVVLFHVFFYFNNIGGTAAFKNAPTYEEGVYRVDSFYQYAVYPWFMVILFIIAGMSSYYALQKRTLKEFLVERKNKLLVPSTLGLLCLGWLSGYITSNSYATGLPQEIPLFIRYFIYCFMGTGALWFCQVLFVASVILYFIRKIDREDKLSVNINSALNKNKTIVNAVILILLFIPLWAFNQILNIPVITSYRMGIYIFSYLIGYYFFANENIQLTLKKLWIPFLLVALVTGFLYIRKFYGTYYGDIAVLKNYLTTLFAYFMCLGLLGLGQVCLNSDKFSNTKFVTYMKKSSFGLYVLHIPVLLVACVFLTTKPIPLYALYISLFIIGLCGSFLFYEILKYIPFIRYALFGIKKKQVNKTEEEKQGKVIK